jgi:integrase
MKAVTCVVLDDRRKLKNGKYPVKLRVTYARKQRYYPADIELTKEEYAQVSSRNPRGVYKSLKLKLSALEQRANDIINGLPHFDFPLFRKRYYGILPTGTDVYSFYEQFIGDLKRGGNLGTASNYECSMRSLKNYRPSLQFGDITVDFLVGYERWMLNNGRSVSTVGIYLRPLRAILNRAISEELVSKEFKYPFGTRKSMKYQIPASRNIKKALSLSEIKQLFLYQTVQGSWEEKALDFWKFSYLANGMNMKDISQLRYKDIDGEYIRFIRSKSARTTAMVMPITVYLSDHLKSIIAKWGRGQELKPEERIFSISSAADTPEKQRADLQQFIKMVNKHIRIIAQSQGISKPVTTYYARHSFSTVLKRSGASIQHISEALGHSSVVTTRSYLDSFEDESKKEMAKLLINFE